MGKTISFVKGKGSITHNNRDFVADNVDRDRMEWNEYYVRQPIKEAYEQIFGPAVEEYNAKQKRKDRKIVELEILNAEKQEAENVIAKANEQVNETTELVEECKQQLEEINAQIEDREKENAIHEKKIEKLLAAEKPVKRELSLIKQDIKQLPALLGGEPYFKISGRNLNRLIDMAPGSGILKNLNTAYEKELTLMEKTIHRLKEQEKTLKAKLKQYELFADMKGLVEAFKEFIRPKTIRDQLDEKKAVIESQKRVKVEKRGLKKENNRGIR